MVAHPVAECLAVGWRASLDGNLAVPSVAVTKRALLHLCLLKSKAPGIPGSCTAANTCVLVLGESGSCLGADL